MNRLPSIIGPAPSERTFQEWIIRLGVERERVQKELALFRSGLLTKGKRKTPTVVKERKMKESAKRKAFLAQLTLIGMTEEEYDERVKSRILPGTG